MSWQTDKTFAFYHKGKNIEIYRLTTGIDGVLDTLDGYKMVVPSSGGTTGIQYPDEDLVNGIRIEYTALAEPFISEALENINVRYSSKLISFSGTTISEIDDSGANVGGFGSFNPGDKIKIQGSKSNDGEYVLTGNASNTALQQANNFTNEAKGEMITITQIPVEVTSPSETSHINLNRMLSLAIVDYLRAMFAERDGDIERKEYYMRNFYKKISDNESNKNKRYRVQSTSFSVK
tara:strand:+ start:4400 stop:5104 length:705 start_codon:yes stop_codon:yes gene_type:complete